MGIILQLKDKNCNFHMNKAAHTAQKKSLPKTETSAANVDGKASDPAIQVLRHFRSVFNAVKTHFQQVEKRAGLGGAQVWALSTIQAHPGIGMNDLAMAMDIHQTTASNLVKILLKNELVKAERKGTDKRAVQLYILSAGRVVLRKAPGPFSGVLPKALSELDPKTLKRLERDLSQLLVLLNADESAAKTPLAQL
jgi:DNA-binding MarR family transcriptional regulator